MFKSFNQTAGESYYLVRKLKDPAIKTFLENELVLKRKLGSNCKLCTCCDNFILYLLVLMYLFIPRWYQNINDGQNIFVISSKIYNMPREIELIYFAFGVFYHFTLHKKQCLSPCNLIHLEFNSRKNLCLMPLYLHLTSFLELTNCCTE